MRVAVTGASGLIGTAVVGRLREEGHTVTRLVRSRDAARAEDAIYWNPAEREIDSDGLAGHEAIVNLAGENIYGIWTDAKKARMYRSRVHGTRLLVETIGGLEDTRRPAVLVNASAIGYYGARPPDEPLAEDAAPGEGFMARLTEDWEAAALEARAHGVRAVVLRFGLVLDPNGVLLQGMSLSTRLGLGAKLGDGSQPFPWTTRADIARVVERALEDPALEGPVNVVAPERVTNEEFADAVAAVLHRPRLLSIPVFVLRALGDVGREVLTGACVVPEKLREAGYEWVDPELEPALRRLLDR